MLSLSLLKTALLRTNAVAGAQPSGQWSQRYSSSSATSDPSAHSDSLCEAAATGESSSRRRSLARASRSRQNVAKWFSPSLIMMVAIADVMQGFANSLWAKEICH